MRIRVPWTEQEMSQARRMAHTVLITSTNLDYGRFLQSLVDQMGVSGRLVSPGALTGAFLETERPALVVLETQGSVPTSLLEWSAFDGFPLAVVSENRQILSDLSKTNGRNTWCFLKPLETEGFVRRIGVFFQEAGLTAEDGALWQGPYLIGIGEAMRTVRATLLRVSRTDLGVLIRGETGTGKGVAALAIHNNSPRRHGPFVEVNCSAIPTTLLESELFGYRKGAFTGAFGDKRGKFDMAHGGSLFLDEISEMSVPMQAKLLQVLQEREYAPLGALENVRSDVRILSASNAPLEDMIDRGRFRMDLYFRLKVVQIDLPALRDRREDVGPLREHFLNKYSALYGCPTPKLSSELRRLMSLYEWPGNVRELENYVKSIVALGSEDEILRDLQEKVQRQATNQEDPEAFHPEEILEDIRRTCFKDVVRRMADDVERCLILEALKESRGNKRKAAQLLGVSPRTLYNKMCALQMHKAPSYKPTEPAEDDPHGTTS